MAADLSVSRSTVKRTIKDLEKAELIRKEAHFRENGSSTSNRYYMLRVQKMRYRPLRGNRAFGWTEGRFKMTSLEESTLSGAYGRKDESGSRMFM